MGLEKRTWGEEFSQAVVAGGGVVVVVTDPGPASGRRLARNRKTAPTATAATMTALIR